ncbi:apolipoprotein N-acyltransferase [Yinghuangia seranimata]|uniref:apolipoprotein N-acyltransferase n=1 Tax=Yinghuangia seranimata TaxID=408067 RepID=UPI00248BF234|nr:apolipoprotein N-acyltransferase [Yinghuangia seranimata]MDI2125861.1 apolipoprotein N-acyltransferase [Yinghuangia seranimata]
MTTNGVSAAETAPVPADGGPGTAVPEAAGPAAPAASVEGATTPFAPGRRGLVLAVLGGLLLFASFEPVDWWPLAFVGPALLVVALHGRTAKQAFRYGFVFGVALFAPLVFWLTNLGWAPFLALTLAESALFGLLTMPVPALLRRRAWPVWVAAWWIAVEAIRGRQPLGGFPWGRLAFSQADSPALGWVTVAGAPGLSLIVVLVPVALAWLVLAGRARRRLPAAGLVGALALVAVGPLLLPSRTGGGPEATVAAVQGNVPRARNLEEQTRVKHVTENHVNVTHQLAADVRAGKVPRPQLVVWPENATDSDPRHDPYLGRIIREAVDDLGVPVLVGAILDSPDGSDRPYNSGLMWRPSNDPVSPGPGEWYAKQHLVPFGEYIPMRDVLGGLGDLQLIPRDFRPGAGPVLFRTGPIVVGDTICYEVGYDGVVRDSVTPGANLMVIQTNNATYERGVSFGQSKQQLDMARIRAVEHNRAAVVASTVGISAVIAPDGTVLAKSGLWEPAVIVKTVPLRDGTTLADRVGYWPELAVCLVAAYAVLSGVRWPAVAARVTRRVSRKATGPEA